MDIDKDRIDTAVLTLSWLNRESSGMAWKGFDWASTERLHERGLISNGGHGEIGLAIRKGVKKGEQSYRCLFVRRAASPD